MKRLLLAVTVTATLAACAQKSDQIAASYVSPNTFNLLSCQQIGEEAQRLSGRVAQATAAQDRKASNDSAMTAVSLVLFWPAAFMIRGNGESAAELGRLKGEMQAVEQANIQKNCGINFRRS